MLKEIEAPLYATMHRENMAPLEGNGSFEKEHKQRIGCFEGNDVDGDARHQLARE